MQVVDKIKSDPNARIKLFVGLPIFLLWFIFFIFIIVANVGNERVKAENKFTLPGDYKTYFLFREQLPFPTWTIRNPAAAVGTPNCKRCSFLAKEGEDECANSPTIAGRSQDNGHDYQFNWDDNNKLQSVYVEKQFISCTIPKQDNFSLIFLYEGDVRPSSVQNTDPYGELIQDVQPGESTVIQYRKVTVFNEDDGIVNADFVTINAFKTFNSDGATYVLHDVVRAKTFYAGKANLPVTGVNVPVVGGHAGITILPLFSQATPASNALSHEDLKALTKRTQDGGTEVVEAKAGKGSATLSMAYAGAVFGDACLKGLNGVPDIVECTFVQSTVTELPFFASKVRLGKNGVEEVIGLGELSAFEKEGLESLKGELMSSIEKGIKFAQES